MSTAPPQPKPKVFISYSWSSLAHSDWIRKCAERLIDDSIDVELDQWSLSGGQDKYAFMEKMVTDPSVTHVLVFSDKRYAEKADARKGGVGTESQIMSKEIYDKVDQKKFVPIVCERRPDGEQYLPTFFQPRIWIDFSTPEKVNENWESLLRHLVGKPLHTKPALGKLPSYLSETAPPAVPTFGKFTALREALVNNKSTIKMCRRDFLDAAIGYADSLRTRTASAEDNFDEKVLEVLHTLLPLRDQLVDWMLLETSLENKEKLEEILIGFLETLLALKYRPSDVTRWTDLWFDAHNIFVYESFIYIIAALIRTQRYELVRTVLSSTYILPDSAHDGNPGFDRFDAFYGYSKALNARNARLKLNRVDLLADELKERATRSDIKFVDIMEVDALLFLVSIISPNVRWYPRTLIYAEYGVKLQLFLRAARHRDFEKIRLMTGITSGDELRKKFNEGAERVRQVVSTQAFGFGLFSIEGVYNLPALDTID